MKKVDILTVLISSATLIIFCLCSYYLLSKYGDIQDNNNGQTKEEISRIEQSIDRLASGQTLDRGAISDQLESNKRALAGHQNEWLLLKQTLISFISILVIIVFSHLFFVYTLFKGMRGGSSRKS
ncbi:MAG: hypothetical protein HRT35_18660 [Algicola sp.]|nr:hypothetical protein [Algicola sp.]